MVRKPNERPDNNTLKPGGGKGLSKKDPEDQDGRLQLEHALEAANMGVWENDLRTQTLTWSREALRLCGLADKKTVTLQDFMGAIHPDDRQLIEKAIRSAIAKPSGDRVEHRVVWPDGSIHWVAVQGRAVRKAGVPVKLIGTVMDIDEQVRTTQQLRYQANILHNISDAIIYTDNEYTIKSWNRGAEELYGWTSAEAVGKNAAELLKTAFPGGEAERREWKEDFGVKGFWRGEVTQRHKDGSTVYVMASTAAVKDESGKVTGGVAVNRNITERVRAENALRESEQRFRSMADSTPVLIWMTDENKAGVYFNKPWLEFTGRSLKDEIGDGWAESIHPDDRAKTLRFCKAAFEKRERFSMEFRLRRSDGAYCRVLDVGTPRYDSDGSFQGYIGSCTDIEEVREAIEKQKELEVKAARLSAEHKQLVEVNQAKDEFISLASHQLRTPATGVKQYIGMLLSGYAGEVSEEQLAMLKRAYDSNERGIQIINSLLLVARVDAGKVRLMRKTGNIVSLIKKVIEEQKADFDERGQRVILNAPSSLKAYYDQEYIRMVIDNLVNNAGKYSYPDTTVSIDVASKDDQVIISVSDQGVGIPKSEQHRLYEKFSRIDNPLTSFVEGNGLGLYWSKKVIDLHNGTINVRSRKGKGSTFSISLPARRTVAASKN
jgi:PAS domain S-box-containing protein